jgi:hypothetical protein
VPVCVAMLVAASLKRTLEKSASGSGTHVVRQAAGASTIHSAVSVSGAGVHLCVENVSPLETFAIVTETVQPSIDTAARSLSPGLTRIGTSTGGAGKSWYQAEYETSPRWEQSPEVPTCSRVCELELPAQTDPDGDRAFRTVADDARLGPTPFRPAERAGALAHDVAGPSRSHPRRVGLRAGRREEPDDRRDCRRLRHDIHASDARLRRNTSVAVSRVRQVGRLRPSCASGRARTRGRPSRRSA